jgi:UDP-hydrolysing UDP-N-acetyl-D-glucosamine 2-epimerase
MSSENQDLEAFYGLPREVKFCKKCVISNQRPNSAVEFQHTKDSKKATIAFDADGVCDACRIAERKKDIDWAARDKELRALCDRYRKNGAGYDCLVPGSGGKDSFYAAHKLKYEYGMNPLTVTWAPHVYTEWGWKNQQAWINAGFDNYLMTPNPRVHRLLTRLAVDNLFHPFQAFILGQKNLAPKMSLLFNIPLVFYGENEAEYGNAISDFSSARRDFRYFSLPDKSKIYLGGTSLADLRDVYGLSEVDWEPYLPADPERLEAQRVEVHYLGYYLKWHPQSCYYYAVENGGFQASPERTPGTYSKYNSIDDRIDDFHYHTTHVKFGIGRATYDAAQEIRSGDINREEGVALVRRFDGEFPERFAEEIFRYLSINEKDFPKAHKGFADPIFTRQRYLELADKFRSPHLWKREANGDWKLRHVVWDDALPMRLAVVTTGRQDWGILRSSCALLRDADGFDLKILAGGMAVSPRFGRVVDGLRTDGFPVVEEMPWVSDLAASPHAEAGRALEATGDALARVAPDALMMVGDRFETIAAAVAATLARVPIIHLHGGEETLGAFDDAFRHAITKMASLHLVSHPEHARRVRAMAEDPESVHVVGAPGLDNIHRADLPGRTELGESLGLSLEGPLVLVALHPTTLGSGDSAGEARAVVAAMDRIDATYVITLPNSDPGNEAIRDVLVAASRKPRRVAVEALGDRRYWAALRVADAILGNSSSALIEAPVVGLPAVNVGDRQNGRTRGANVLDAPFDADAITAALKTALTPAFRADARRAGSPFGDGRAAEKIVSVLRAWRAPRPPMKRLHLSGA